MTWVDTHSHLNDESFDGRVHEVVERASRAGVAATLVIGIDRVSSERAVNLAQEYPSLYAVVGIQPNSLGRLEAGDWDAIVALADHPKVVGIGETGLDRYWDFAAIELQQEYFAKHLRFARERDLPVIIHCREAEVDVLAMLRDFSQSAGGPVRGVMHSFCGDLAVAKACLELGLYLSFAGMATFKKNESLRQVAAATPIDRILVETDSPYLAPEPVRGRPNEPAFVAHTGARLAASRGMDVEGFASATSANARSLFRLPNDLGCDAPPGS